MATNNYKSKIRLIVVSDDIEQTAAGCPDFKSAVGSVAEVVQFGTRDVDGVNKTFPVLSAIAFLGKFNGSEPEGDESDMVGVVDFANTRCPEFAQFMYGYMLSQGVYCYAIGVDAGKADSMKAYVQSMCAYEDACSEQWTSAVSSIDFSEPLSYLLCGVVVARFDPYGYQTVLFLGDGDNKPVDLLICALLSCYNPLSGNPVISEGKASDAPRYPEDGELPVRTIILNL